MNGNLDCTDHRQCSALHYAAAGGSAPSSLFLLQQQAMVDRSDVSGTTPLMLALGAQQVVFYLAFSGVAMAMPAF